MIHDDVLVIGGGLAGISAALAAAETGARTRLLSHKESTLRHASGLIDVLGYPPGANDPLVDPFEAIPSLPAGHPYERVGVDAVRAGLDRFDAALGDQYAGGHTDANALVPTYGGTIKPTARYPASVAPGLASDTRDALLIGFETVPDFDAPLAASHLRVAGVPFSVRGVTIEFPGNFRTDATITRLAEALDRSETVDGRSIRTELATRVEAHLDGEERVGFPALLGDDDPDGVRATLEAELGVDVFEVPMGPPSLLGLRLERTLSEELSAAGVRITTGIPVVGYEAEGDGIRAVSTDRNGAQIPYYAEQIVLATGGLVGKGIKTDRTGVREPIFDCHVSHPNDRYEWFRDAVYGDHPFAQFGVTVDRDLRPLDAREEPEFSNLRAAGAVLGGYDMAAEKSGAGVSLSTGNLAGTLAGEET